MSDTGDRLPPMFFQDDFVEHNLVAWRIEPGELDPNNPLLEPKYPWDTPAPCIGHGTVLKDPLDGVYKAWTCAIGQPTLAGKPSHPMRLTYACSEDGVHWDRPELDVLSFEQYERTNLLFHGKTSYASVFVDPESNPDEPYEIFVMRRAVEGKPVEGFEETPHWPPDDSVSRHSGRALYRYRSRDGIHWRPYQGPIQLHSGDTAYLHKDPTGGYVYFCKNLVRPLPGGGFDDKCRVGMRRYSPDGFEWTATELNMLPDYLDHPGDQIMEVGRYPYREGFIGLTAVFHAHTKTMDVQFAASRDGENWWRPEPRRPILGLQPLGDNGGGLIWPTRTLIEEGDRLYLYFGADPTLHNDIYSPSTGTERLGLLSRASWAKGRMVGAVCAGFLFDSPDRGTLTTRLLDCEGKRLRVNAVTVGGGELRVELLDEQRRPLAGFSRDDCIPFRGDEKFAVMHWGGGDLPGQSRVHVRFVLRDARLYGFEWGQA